MGTFKEAKARIKEISGIDLSISQIKYFLDQIGIKRRKVKQSPDRLDIEKQENFKKQALEPLIERAQKREIQLFFGDLNNARYQKNNFIQAYAEQLRITLVFLPAYSPDLNLIERLWKFVKKEALYSTYIVTII